MDKIKFHHKIQNKWKKLEISTFLYICCKLFCEMEIKPPPCFDRDGTE